MENVIREIRADIEAIESDTALYEERNFNARAEALDSLEFDVIERVEGLLPTNDRSGALWGLKQRADLVRLRLERVDEGLFRRLRHNIASGNYTSTELKQQIVGYAVDSSTGRREGHEGHEGYDNLDAFVNGLLLTEAVPEGIRPREPEMVFYQPTPVRIVLEMVNRADFRRDDVFYDIGSGLGQVTVLVHLLSEVQAKGIEVELAYCDYARRCARGLNLSQVEFINVDAREADYSDGTSFFLYTPFEGRMLERVLERLKENSRKRRIQLYTYGPCTLQVVRQRWLERVDQNGNRVDRLAVFKTSERGLGVTQPPILPGRGGHAPNNGSTEDTWLLGHFSPQGNGQAPSFRESNNDE